MLTNIYDASYNIVGYIHDKTIEDASGGL